MGEDADDKNRDSLDESSKVKVENKGLRGKSSSVKSGKGIQQNNRSIAGRTSETNGSSLRAVENNSSDNLKLQDSADSLETLQNTYSMMSRLAAGSQYTGLVPGRPKLVMIPDDQDGSISEQRGGMIPTEQTQIKQNINLLQGTGMEHRESVAVDTAPVVQKQEPDVAQKNWENECQEEIGFKVIKEDQSDEPDDFKVENGIISGDISVKHESQILTYNMDNTVQCRLCPFVSKYKNNVIRHCKFKHSNSPPSFPCWFCEFMSSNRSTLKRHIYRVHKSKASSFPKPEKGCRCCLCNAVFSTKDELTLHKQEVHKYTPLKYWCNDCDYVTERNDTLITHQRVIHNNTQFCCCCRCSKTFYYKLDLENHVCKGEPLKIKCHLCEKTFSSEKCVQAHVKSHSGEGLYYCDKCDQKFFKRFQLQRHHNIKHEKNIVYFKCEFCSSSFLYKSSLQRHMKLAHVNAIAKRFVRKKNSYELCVEESKLKRFKCPKCLCSFHYEGILKHHMEKKHSDDLAAEYPESTEDTKNSFFPSTKDLPVAEHAECSQDTNIPVLPSTLNLSVADQPKSTRGKKKSVYPSAKDLSVTKQADSIQGTESSFFPSAKTFSVAEDADSVQDTKFSFLPSAIDLSAAEHADSTRGTKSNLFSSAIDLVSHTGEESSNHVDKEGHVWNSMSVFPPR